MADVKANELIARCRDEGLNDLDLSSFDLPVFPVEIYELRRLNVLRFRGNRISELPAGIGSLTNLEILDLSSNALKKIPRDIADLSNLIDLNLEGNKLGFVPRCVCSLPRLQILRLSDNRIAELPPEIRELASLRYLDVSFNLLITLPREIGSLQHLEKLVASINQLSSVPPELGNLRYLRELFLESNKLRSLPENLARLERLAFLRLGRNRLNIPVELLKQPTKPKEILAWYFHQRHRESRPLNEAKLLVLGHGGVGKTSIVRRLITNSFDLDTSRTEGIDISPWTVQLGADNIRVNIWDFGGQATMHAAHRFFLTEKAVYLLVIEPRQESQEAHIRYWLQLINTFAPSSSAIVVCNKSDIAPHNLNWPGLEKTYPTAVFVKSVSCLNGRGMDDVKSAVLTAIGGMSEVREHISREMLDVKTELESQASDYISYDEYRKLCATKGVVGDRVQDALAEYLHHLGTIHKLKVGDTFILNPQWVTVGIYRIINYHKLAQTRGVFSLADMEDMLPTDGRYPPNKYLFLVNILKECGLCFEYGYPDARYLIPDVLPTDEPLTGDWVDALNVRLQYETLPRSICSQFIVAMHSYVFKSTYWRFGVVLQSKDANARALVRVNQDKEYIEVLVDGEAADRQELWLLVREAFRQINEGYAGVRVAELLRLPDGRMIDYEAERTLRRSIRGESGAPGRLSLDTPMRDIGMFEAGSTSTVNIYVLNSEIENLKVVASEFNSSGQESLGHALVRFTESLRDDKSLNDETKAEVIESVQDLVEQLRIPPSKRIGGRVKGAMAHVTSVLKGAGEFTLKNGETLLKIAKAILDLRTR